MGFEYQGKICNKIFPGIGGEMRLIRGNTPQDTKIMIFQAHTPAPIEFKEFTPPPTAEEAMHFSPPVKEAWMNDPAQDLNHESNRLVISDLKGNYKILFHEYGQKGWWWISPNLKKIHILTDFIDYTKSDEGSLFAITQTHLSTSFDGGETFHKNEKFEKMVGKGYASNMVFDPTGNIGYIFFNRNIVWQVIDAGLNFYKYYIPHTNLTLLKSTDSGGVNQDAAMVDNHGNLLFALFEPMENGKVGANIYEIDKKETTNDLSQRKPKYSFPGKRIIALSHIPDKEGFYMFYLECGDNKNCNWSTEEDKRDNNPHLHFGLYLEGEELKTGSYDFFLEIEHIFVGNHGDIAVTMNMMQSNWFKIMVSHDYGRNWAIQDLSYVPGMAADYVDFEHKEFWLQSSSPASYPDNEIYKGKIP